MRSVSVEIRHKLLDDLNQHVDESESVVNQHETRAVSVRKKRDVFVQSDEERRRDVDLQTVEQQI